MSGAAGVPARAIRILLAEDNPTNQLVAQGMLELAGYTDVVTVEDGEEAVAAVREGTFDIVIMDCQMPRLDGYQATARLREAGVSIPVIALTASALPHERERCLAHGMNDFLAKPVDEAALADAIARWTGGGACSDRGNTSAPKEVGGAFSRAAALAQLSGDEELLAAVLESFRRQGPSLIAKARAALESGDAEALRRHLHSLVGSAGTLGAEALTALARELEDHAGSARFEQVALRMPQLEALMSRFLVAAQSW